MNEADQGGGPPGGRKFRRYGSGPGGQDGGPGSEGPGESFYRGNLPPIPEAGSVSSDLDSVTQGKKGVAREYKTTGGQ